MLKRIRQVGVMVRDIEGAIKRWNDLFGLECSERHDLKQYGLVNAILPMQNTVLELLQPVDPNSAGARFLERRGEGLYMLIFEVESRDRTTAHLQSQGFTITGTPTTTTSKSAFIHPRSFFGTFVELSEPLARPAPQRRYPRNTPIVDIKQAVILVRDMGAALATAYKAFGLVPTAFNELEYGARTAYLPLGSGRLYGKTFLELLTPTRPDAASARYLERNGEGPYLLIFQVKDLESAVRRVKENGGQITMTAQESEGHQVAWVHPRSANGVFVQFSHVTHPTNPWPPGGEWQKRRPRG